MIFVNYFKWESGDIYSQSSVKKPTIKNTSSNNTFHLDVPPWRYERRTSVRGEHGQLAFGYLTTVSRSG